MNGDQIKNWGYDLDWYSPPQLSWPAAIRLENKTELTISGETLKRNKFEGFGVFLYRCRGITIRRSTISGFYYPVFAVECQDVFIEDCDLGFNFNRPGTGWIISDDPRYQGDYYGWGGGVYFRKVRGGAIRETQLGNQFNGADLIECHGVSVLSNRIVHTSNYAIHLRKSHECTIQGNDCRYAIRFTPRFARDTADSAAILIEGGSCRNRIVNNDLRYSGDGLFVRDLTQGQEPSNENYIARNDCSHSPNNAIEAVFSQGNVFEANEASFSNYGAWLDFSVNLVLRGNTIARNESEGIHIKLGSFKELLRNLISHNPIGFKTIKTPVRHFIPLNLFEANGINLQEEEER